MTASAASSVRHLRVAEPQSIPEILWSFFCELVGRIAAGFVELAKDLIDYFRSFTEGWTE